MYVTVVLILASFFIGAIPFGYLIVKNASGINIQEFGSGNIGSTNVKRVVGKKQAALTQVLDILKGLLPTLLVFLTKNNEWVHGLPNDITLMVAFATILGHDFTPFLRFKGGRGVNTTMGASLVVAPISTLLSFLVYIIAKKIGKYASVGSLLIGISLPLFNFIQYGASTTLIYLTLAGILLIIRHLDNIKRLITGTENL